MLYEVITRALHALHGIDEVHVADVQTAALGQGRKRGQAIERDVQFPGRTADLEVLDPRVEVLVRITSYNVCYTKLLRTGWAAYLDLTYAFTDNFDVSFGVRYTDDKKDFSLNVPNPETNLGPSFAYLFSTDGTINSSNIV